MTKRLPSFFPENLPMQRKAWAVARVSTNNQMDSLEVQTRIIANYCKDHSELDFQQIFELHESAYCLGLKQLDTLIKKLPSKAAIIFNKIDRFSRNPRDFNNCSELIKKNDLEFHFIEEGIIWNKNSDRNTENTIYEALSCAEKESIKISNRVKAVNGLNRTYRKISYAAPLGYINYKEGNDKGWKLDKQKALVVKHIFEWYATGKYSLTQIASMAFAEGLSGKISSKKSVATKLRKQAVSNLLTNPFYIGEARYGNTTYKHKYPKLISKELFNKCQQVFNQRTHKTEAKSKDIKSPFVGLVREHTTNKLFTPYDTKGFVYLKSPIKGVKDLKESVIDMHILRMLKQLSNNPQLSDQLSHELNKDTIVNINLLANELNILEKQKKQIEDNMCNLLTNPPTTAPKSMVEKAIEQLDSQIKLVEQKISQKKDIQKQQKKIQITDNLVKTYHSLNTQNKSLLLKSLFTKISYDNGILHLDIQPIAKEYFSNIPKTFKY